MPTSQRRRRPPATRRDIARTLIEFPAPIRAALDEIKRRDGISITAQVIRAVALYAKTKGIEVQV